jgi:hypothetical protein
MADSGESLSGIMRKVILILNIVLAALMLQLYIFWISDKFLWRGNNLSYAFSWYLPFAIAAVSNITGGSLIWKKKRILWAIMALVFAVIVLVLYFIALYVFPHFAFTNISPYK